MTITNCLVSDEPAEDVPFLVNPDWSGSSSAVRELNDRPKTIEFKMAARTVDSVVPEKKANGAIILFKMDIEGYESRALKGFTRCIEQAGSAIGFIEFDGQYIRWAGEDPNDYLDWLQERFHTYRLESIKAKTIRPVDRFEEIPNLHGDPNRVHVDLILVTNQSPDGWLAPEWTILT